eukprot:gnl/TRDRNA2_/TRDRNA2_176864_c4_seq16.p1 gnl/TRDRNA2_/TRDRNA2_176864_c4~~gnl/TRDRNA2_/TRDRNA2_176864_c4_seq16.p1  ORF type:complete len:362 (-),score=53.13 gnl/TRDRNA2_/TRDRNA2_176864_c4_seq16:160-1245(-)
MLVSWPPLLLAFVLLHSFALGLGQDDHCGARQHCSAASTNSPEYVNVKQRQLHEETPEESLHLLQTSMQMIKERASAKTMPSHQTCTKGFFKAGVCWVWAASDSFSSKPTNRFRAPTEKEWKERPAWRQVADHCHTQEFGGGRCDIAHAKKHGDICFCRAKGDCDGQSKYCDLMYVRNPDADKEDGNPPPTKWTKGLLCEFYGGKFDKVPDMQKMKPAFEIVEETLHFPKSKFPWKRLGKGMVKIWSWFSARCMGAIKVKKSGYYKIKLSSDDGSKLYLNKKKLIDNDGLHDMRSKTSGETHLKAVKYVPIRVEWFDKIGPAGLVVKYKHRSNNKAEWGNFNVLPEDELWHDKDAGETFYT